MNKSVWLSLIFLTSNIGLIAQDGLRLGNARVLAKSETTGLPLFMKPGGEIQDVNFADWAAYALGVPANSAFKPYEVMQDELGFVHTRYKQFVNDLPVEGSMLISHSKQGIVQTINGDYYQHFSSNLTAAITEQAALQKALQKVGGKRYMWQNTLFQKQTANNYYPSGQLVIAHKKDADYAANNMRLAYKFNIYAEVPLYRAYVYVDANTGEILDEQNLICTIDAVGTASTRFSGNVTMTSDSTGPGAYRLHETGRGNGIQTYNLNHSVNYVNTDFTNNSANWNLTGPDQVATDAHWGAEMTYDYYQSVHSRNSIDGNGFTLKNYVHYGNNFLNAFWDGQEMTYGDGNVSSGYYPFVCLDVCGHEITHGLTNFTAGLGGGAEAGALNEGFSDIFGTTIEAYARPAQTDWKMGAEMMVNGVGLRDMSQPKNLGQPNTYHGQYWDSNGEVHQNNGPCIYWYYLLCQGGSGINDLGHAWSVSGITMAKAQMIAYRGLTMYFTPNTNYALARAYTVQAAIDLYGACSTEYQMTMNAWYAVGVGSNYIANSVTPAFINSAINCSVPIAVTFNNTSANAAAYFWSFGDGGTSTLPSPTHTFNVAGPDTVKLVATSCGGTKDSITKILFFGATAAGTSFSEGYEITSLPGTDWTVAGTGNDWAITNAASATGVKAAMIDNTTNPKGSANYMETISYDISAMAAPKLTFKMAYRQAISTNLDKLQVLSSIDCGANWLPRWTKSGSALATVTPPDTIPFFPGTSQFTTYTVNINALTGHNNVRFRFNFIADTAGAGNNIFIDDINLFDAAVGIEEVGDLGGVELYPNPSSGKINIDLGLAEEKEVSVTIMDMLGRTVEALPATRYAAGIHSLSVGEKQYYEPGIYLANIRLDDKLLTKRIVIE